jgi:Na+/proline symporter
LSSVDAAIHSGSSVLVVDLYNRLLKRRRLDRSAAPGADLEDDRAQVRALRAAAIVMGVLGTTLACNVEGIGTLLEINKKVTDSFAGPLFGIFLLAMFSPRTSSAAALAGGVAGALAAYLVAYQSSIGFFWPSTFGLVATLAVGIAASYAATPASDHARSYTWKAIMRRPSGD